MTKLIVTLRFKKSRTPEGCWTEDDVAKWKDGIDYLITMYNKRIDSLKDLLAGSNEDILEYYFGMRGIEFVEAPVNN